MPPTRVVWQVALMTFPDTQGSVGIADHVVESEHGGHLHRACSGYASARPPVADAPGSPYHSGAVGFPRLETSQRCWRRAYT